MQMYGVEERKRRWSDFLLSDGHPGHNFLIDYEPDHLERPPLWPDKKEERIEWAWQEYERQIARMEWQRDDAIPYLNVCTGTEIFAEAFGCTVIRPTGSMPFARPLITTASEVSGLKVPEVTSGTLSLLFQIADELVRRAGPRTLLKMVDLQSPMDIAALIWEKGRFYMALIDTPEAVRELADKVQQLLTLFLDEWFSRYGREFVAHYPAYYMPAGITLSEDEVGCVSTQAFDDLFLPELSSLSDQYGGIGIHCCANARHQWDSFKKIPRLRMLNLVQPEDELRAAYALFAAHAPQMHSWCGDGNPWTWPAQYPQGARVVLQATAKTREEALVLSERLWEACGRE